jgi:hypothetical protein
MDAETVRSLRGLEGAAGAAAAGAGVAFCANALEANVATRATVRIVFFMVFQFGVFGFRQCPPPQPGREKHLRTEALRFRSKNQEVFPNSHICYENAFLGF